MAPEKESVAEYIQALKASGKFGPQVAAHRIFAATSPSTLAPELLAPELQELLQNAGIDALYSHQHAALKHIQAQKNTIVATPTASGKSLIYTLPVLQAYLNNPSVRALYLFPLKALAQDQMKTVERLWHLLPDSRRTSQNPVAIYDGDTSPYQRKKIRDHLPNILITNPDMLHLSMLPYHDRWRRFFSELQFIVIDEVHTYRGIFGSHVAWVLRRLKRICALYGAKPTFILASATIGNPSEHAQLLLDAPVEEITLSGAGKAVRNVILLNPLDSAASSATLLLEAAITRKLRTIVYCQSRKMTELITIWTEQRLKQHRNILASYRSGFLPEERRSIENRLANGEILGVISTSALELGIDIGHLDLCILVGYPGSIMATWQRAGRVGRKNQESLVLLIGHEDALDQHFMRNPDDFFDRSPEPVTIHPGNPHITAQHLVCAAAELPLTADEPLLCASHLLLTLSQLTWEGRLLQSAEGKTWFSPRTYPQRYVSLRGGGITLKILLQPQQTLLGEIDCYRALQECHPGAIYLHRAQTYHVDKLDLECQEILASAATPPYFTRVLSEKSTEILEEKRVHTYGAMVIHYGVLRVTETIIGFHKIALGNQKILARVPLQLPPQIFETEGLWVEIPQWLQQRMEIDKLHFMGGIHAMEHAMIGVMPLIALCDRNDLGGISCPWHDQVGGPAIFVYDGHAGGIGLTAKGYASIEQLMRQTRRVVVDCTCEMGCPSCVHSPKCGSGNRPIDKQACIYLLENLMMTKNSASLPHRPIPPNPLRIDPSSASSILPLNFGVFDIETQKSAEEVGGWHKAHLMRVSVAVLFENATQQLSIFTENSIDQLIERLFALELVVGFNNKRFDNQVLSAYTNRDLATLPSFDILETITERLGYRLSLDRLAEKNLGRKKEGDGLLALRWFKQGQMQLLTEYCQKDVEITKELFLLGLRQQYFLFQNKAGQEVRLPVNFAHSITEILKRGKQMLKARQDLCSPNQ